MHIHTCTPITGTSSTSRDESTKLSSRLDYILAGGTAVPILQVRKIRLLEAGGPCVQVTELGASADLAKPKTHAVHCSRDHRGMTALPGLGPRIIPVCLCLSASLKNLQHQRLGVGVQAGERPEGSPTKETWGNTACILSGRMIS